MLLADWRVLTRRWYVVLPGLLVTIALAWAATIVFPATQQLRSSLLLLPPETKVDGVALNPFLNLGGLEGMADVLSTGLSDTSVEDELLLSGYDVDYSIGRDPSAAGPVLVLEVEAATEAEALGAQAELIEIAPRLLNELQDRLEVREAARIGITVVTDDGEAEAVRKTQTRGVLIAVVGGLALTYLSAALLDGLITLRRTRKLKARLAAEIPVAEGEAEQPLAAESPAPEPAAEPAAGDSAPAEPVPAGPADVSPPPREPVAAEPAATEDPPTPAAPEDDPDDAGRLHPMSAPGAPYAYPPRTSAGTPQVPEGVRQIVTSTPRAPRARPAQPDGVDGVESPAVPRA